ncbi:MAG: hypothetical protein IJW31_07445 [Lentisphaeria bacterium]|nr:hypothetical protein [Lentisphaeria bacterium]MBQ9789411.1 hypothetical protein [Lentisphaeria bacterium]
MKFFNGTASWIAPEDGVMQNCEAGRAMLFRRTFQGKGELTVAVSADTDYRLFCNNIEVAQGPAASDDLMTFYDVVDLTPYLKNEKNELVAEVVGFASAFPDFYRGGAPMGKVALRDCFILDGTLKREDGSSEFIGTDKNWEAANCSYINFYRCPGVPCAGPGEWHNGESFAGAEFSPAQVIEIGFREENVKNSNLYYRLRERIIPFMDRKIEKFKSFFDVHGISENELSKMLDGEKLTISPCSKIDFTLDMEYETTGRILLRFLKGKADVKFFYAENFFVGEERHFDKNLPHDEMTGPMNDHVSSKGGEWTWKAFYYRAFRFVRVVITTYYETCELQLAEVEREVYPYKKQGFFDSNDLELNRLYEIGYRALELCSHNVFEDCPYYERVQYPADSRIAARIAMLNCGDTLLAEQAIIHYRHSIRENGLTAGSYPSRSPLYLPIWSLHYAAMVYELYQYKGDITLLEENLWAIRRVLEFFMRHRCPEGGIGKLPYWDMVDFARDWFWLGEAPKSDKQSSAYVTFFVAEILKYYQEMSEIVGNKFDALWAEDIYNQLKKESEIFYDKEKKVYADNTDFDTYSYLINAEAILSGISDDRELLKNCYKLDKITTPAFFGQNFVFDAAFKCGDLATAEKIMSDRKKMLVPGRTVTPEGTPIPRSECHVWTAMANYGLYQLYAGFKILEPGGTKIRITPLKNSKINFKGALFLVQGAVEFDFNNSNYSVKIPKNVTIQLADGREFAEHDKYLKL